MAEIVRVEGLSELQKNLDKLAADVKRGGLIRRGLLAGARLMRDEARRRAPVLAEGTLYRTPGALRKAIVHGGKRYVEHLLTAIVRVRSRGYIFAEDSVKNRKPDNPNYWWLVEFGTARTRPQPFMRPAFEAKKMEAVKVIKAAIEDEIRKAAAGFRYPARRRRR